jgi:exosortase D (VPLPA-CTERM-specific)
VSATGDGLAGGNASPIHIAGRVSHFVHRRQFAVQLALGVVTLACLARVFAPALRDIYFNWTSFAEYSYGPLVPVIAAIMLYRDARRSPLSPSGTWIGVAIFAAGCALGLVTAISPFVYPANVGLLIAITGLFIAFHGWRRARTLWPGFVYLIFALPLPGLMFGRLTAELQIVSSEIGVAFIRLFDVPVLREGNVIDLGALKLQVAEACSGLRYLLPLASFSFLAAYLFRAPAWQRIVLFLSSLPITIAMNSFRIGVTGLFADRFGIGVAQGFLHDFEGWLVFCACVCLLILEMKLFCLMGGGRSLADRLDLSWPRQAPLSKLPRQSAGPLFGTTVVALAVVVLASLGAHRSVIAPAREALVEFPDALPGYRGADLEIPQETVDALRLSDYLSMSYQGAGAAPIGLWIAYYNAQKFGDATHSPRFCIPGSGWNIDALQAVSVGVPGAAGSRDIPVNRAVISKDGVRQLVYYWFQERGRSEANEYLVKLHILLDGLTFERTDGALVRLTVPLSGGDAAAIRKGDAQLRHFASSIYPLLPRFIPN